MTDWAEVMRLCKAGRRGDALELVVKPVALMLGLECVDKETGALKEDSGCAKRRDRLNSGPPISPPRP